MKRYLLLLIFILFFINCNRKNKNKELLIFCSAANKEPISQIADKYENKYKINIKLITGGSGTLYSMIKINKRGDIYIPASNDYLKKGYKDNLFIKNSDKIIAYLVPAIIVQKNNRIIKNIYDLTNKKIRLGICNPQSAAVGLYTISIFQKNNILKSALKNVKVMFPNISQAVNSLLLNNIDAFIGWREIERWNNKLKAILLKPNQLPAVAYIPAVIIRYSTNKKLAESFIKFVLSQNGKEIYRKYGYILSKNNLKKYITKFKIGVNETLPLTYLNIIDKNEK